jgi:hypothetical protein
LEICPNCRDRYLVAVAGPTGNITGIVCGKCGATVPHALAREMVIHHKLAGWDQPEPASNTEPDRSTWRTRPPLL